MSEEKPAGRDTTQSPILRQFLKPIQTFLNDERYTGLAINRPGEVYCRTRSTWDYYAVPELTYEHCERLAQLVASFNGKTKSLLSGHISGILPDGERVNVGYPPAVQARTVSFVIRKFTDEEKTVEELEADGTFSLATVAEKGIKSVERDLLRLRDQHSFAEFLRLAVESKQTIIICGGTGSGKTYLTKSLIRCIPDDERLITIEDAWELRLQHHKNKVHLFFSREENNGVIVTAKESLAACLRMEPSRILLAELRGDEAWEFIKAVGTGHPGSISTIHANSAVEAFDQALALIKDSKTGAHLDTEFIKRRLYATIDIVLFYSDRTLREIYYDPEFKRKNMA